MALVGHISGSSQSNSVIGISGSVIIANEPNVSFPSFPGSDISFFVSGSTNGRNEGYGVSIFGGQLVVSGASYNEGGIYATSVSGSGNFDVGGDLRVAGDLRIDGNDIKSSDGTTAITLNGGEVIIPGDLTINGTMTTVNTTNLEIKDALIGLGFASGSDDQASGDRGFIGGLDSTNDVAMFWDDSENEFAVATTTSGPGSTSVTIADYSQFHASTLTGSLVKANALTGSLTKLIDGSDYLRGGSNISLTTGSSGEVTIGVTGLSGYVVGPASATNDAIAVYDGTTGKLIKNSNLSVGTRTTTQNYVTASVNLNNYGLALIPSGTGPLSARAPDGTAIGGDARGSNAVDFQMVRASSSQVAEGIRSVIVGGQNNRAIGESATIVGGSGNVVSARFGFIGSGDNNSAGEFSFIGTGGSNSCSAERSFIGAGNNNTIASGISRSAIVNGNQNSMTITGGGGTEGQFIGSGRFNAVKHTFSSIVGGDTNTASSTHTFIGGGNLNVVSGSYSVVVGGQYNSSSNDYVFAGGGQYNTGSGLYSTVVGGVNNIASGERSFVGGGGSTTKVLANEATGQLSTIAGGENNVASSTYTSIVGGRNNTASATDAFVGGGRTNTASNQYAVVCGGETNQSTGAYSFIGGGLSNIATNTFSAILCGDSNYANGSNSAICGGSSNSALGGIQFIGGGRQNRIITNAAYSSIVGGEYNTANGYSYTFVGGGQYNTGSGQYSSVIGGLNNTAQSYGETSLGLYSTTGAGSQISYVSTDRLLSIGNGTSTTTRSNALTLIKNGDLHLSGTLTLMSGSTSGITFPTTRGTNGQVLTSDGAGLITWQTPVSQPSYFTSTTAGSIYTTGSAAFIGNEVGIDAPSDKGSDVSFYVSGSTDGSSIALFGGGIVTSGSLSVFGNTTLGDTTSDLITFNARAGTDFLPANDNQYNLGSATNRWANVYTGDLHLRNDRGDWTVIEEDEYLSIRNNKTGKLYRLVMEPVGE